MTDRALLLALGVVVTVNSALVVVLGSFPAATHPDAP